MSEVLNDEVSRHEIQYQDYLAGHFDGEGLELLDCEFRLSREIRNKMSLLNGNLLNTGDFRQELKDTVFATVERTLTINRINLLKEIRSLIQVSETDIKSAALVALNVAHNIWSHQQHLYKKVYEIAQHLPNRKNYVGFDDCELSVERELVCRLVKIRNALQSRDFSSMIPSESSQLEELDKFILKTERELHIFRSVQS